MSSQEKAALLMIKGAISELPPEGQENYKEAYSKIKEVIAKYPNGEAFFALTTITLEASLEA